MLNDNELKQFNLNNMIRISICNSASINWTLKAE